MKNIDAITAYRPTVVAGLESFIKQHKKLSGGGLAWSADVIERLNGFATSGKMLRGSLVCYSYAICSGIEAGKGPAKSLPPAVLNTAAAIELTHAGLLIHDDIIDQDDLRRGQPAMHRQYSQTAAVRRLAGASRLGEGLALCAGDMILFLAFELVAAAKSETSDSLSLSKLFVRELTTVCAGQMQDIYLGALPTPPAKRDIYAVMRAKTATYSLALPLEAGAILAGRPAALRKQLHDIGMAAGTMFQIRDDELGSLGRSSDIGKPVGSDIRESKKTLLYYYLWQASGTAERRRLATIFGNPEASQADINYVRGALRRCRIPDRLHQDIARLEKTAFRHIDRLLLSRTAKSELRDLVRFCAARKF